MYPLNRTIKLTLTLTTFILISSCGGGGDSGTGGSGGGAGTKNHIVSATAGAGGAISPASRTVANAQTTTFTVSTNTGYSISSVSGCGGSLSGNTYTTGAVTSACTVNASFSLNSYTVTATAGEGGSITPASQTISHGSTTSFDISVGDGYQIDNVSGCGGVLSGFSYVTSQITTNCTVNVSFELQPPEAPTVALTPQSIRTFSFSWTNVSRVNEYRLFENADGTSGYNEVAIIDADANSFDLVVFLPARINASYILAACNSSGCADSEPVFVSGFLTEAIGYFKASTTGEYIFGESLALSGDGKTLAVGAPAEASNATGINGNEADSSVPFSGAVYIFINNGITWVQQAYVKASNTGTDDSFGSSLALSGDGNTLSVGARYEDSNATSINGNEIDNSNENSGAVYVFNRNGANWTQQAYVKASNTETGDFFGRSLALSGDGNTLVVGAPNEDSSAVGINGNNADNNAVNSGAVYIFSRAGISWSQLAYIKGSNTEAFDRFGEFVSLSSDGTTLAVGAVGEDSGATGVNGDQTDNFESNSGAIYLFTLDNSSWNQQAYIKASNTEASDQFGSKSALSADGNTLVVAASGEDSSATGINGDQANNLATSSGAVYVFNRENDIWSQQAYIKASNAEANDFFGGGVIGSSIALSDDGRILAVGAWGESSNAIGLNSDGADNSALGSGAVYLFAREGYSWTQIAYIKASNANAGDLFGESLDISADGTVLAVGAISEASNTIGINGNQNDNSLLGSGAVYLY